MNYELLDEFTDYIKLGLFFRAHEILEEDLWIKKDKSPENLYVKGLINAAVAMELHRKGRREAGERVWQTYKKYKIDTFYEINYRVEVAYEKISSSSSI